MSCNVQAKYDVCSVLAAITYRFSQCIIASLTNIKNLLHFYETLSTFELKFRLLGRIARVVDLKVSQIAIWDTVY